MTATFTATEELVVPSTEALVELVGAYVERQHWWDRGPDGTPEPADRGSITVRCAHVVVPGRPGVVSVEADVGDRVVHALLGLRAPGEEAAFLPEVERTPLGILDGPEGLAVAYDALADAELATALLASVAGEVAEPERVRRSWLTDETVSLTFDDRLSVTVFQVLPGPEEPHRGVEMFLALEEVGFNHLSAPLALWRRGGYDLGVVMEYESGAVGGWAVALTSLRDLYASGGAPERAGADFGQDARRLGEMTARMHLGLDQAYGRLAGDVSRWVVEVEDAVRVVDPDLLASPEVQDVLEQLRTTSLRCVAIRTHGDFHLGRVVRTDIGWFVLDFSPGGTPMFSAATMESGGRTFRSPLADVADMLWSFGHVADVAAGERDPSGRLGLSELAHAWEVRNRRAFLADYLATPGIGGLVPPSRDVVRRMVAAFELERSASKLALRLP